MVHRHESQQAQAPAEQAAEQQQAGGELGLGIDPNELLEAVATFAKDNPHAAMAGAAAIGFLLGGGLTPRLLGAIAMFAGRKYFSETMRETVESALHEQLSQAART